MSSFAPIRVVVFGENVHEQTSEAVQKVYPDGMHACIADVLNTNAEISATTVTLQMPDHGLTQEVLDQTDVLIWWGHAAHDKVQDDVVDRVVKRVHAGMGLIVLHSGHFSKPFVRLMGTTCALSWREAGEKERLWVTTPGHAIAAGIENGYFEIDHEEMYGEPFGIPEPQETVFISWFAGGEVFRSGCTWRRGAGKIFYFRPGHEVYPTYHHPIVQRVIANGVKWAKPEGSHQWECPNRPISQALEPLVEWGESVH